MQDGEYTRPYGDGLNQPHLHTAALDAPDTASLFQADHGQCQTLGIVPPGAANAVHTHLRIKRYVHIEHTDGVWSGQVQGKPHPILFNLVPRSWRIFRREEGGRHSLLTSLLSESG
jgi:hypothetical protein